MKITAWLAATAFVMLGLPYLAVTFVKADAGMAASVLLFFVIDPLYAVFSGTDAGGDIKKRWFMPGTAAGLYLAGAWLSFQPGEMAFLLYAAAYLIIGTAAMLITAALRGRIKINKGQFT
jgi:hypothetical protein